MRPLPPKNVNRHGGNKWVGFLLIVIGAGFVGVTLQDGLPLGLFHNAYNTASFLLFVAVGVALIAWGVRAIFFSRAFGQAEVEVSPRIESGGEFEFHYAQAALRQMTVQSIDVYFVYREKVGEAEGASPYLFDRLIARQTFPGRALRKGERIDLDCALWAPVGEMGMRNPYMLDKSLGLECLWVVRLRVRYGKSSEVWEDYQIDIVPGADAPPGPAESAQQAELFDVLLRPSLVENTTSIRETLKEIAPHLSQSGIPYAQHEVANVICERLDQKEAEALADKLESAGAMVDIIPTEATWRIPAQNGQAQTGDTPNL